MDLPFILPERNLIIAGGTGKGVLYGVYGLLELWGFRMYTSTGYPYSECGFNQHSEKWAVCRSCSAIPHHILPGYSATRNIQTGTGFLPGAIGDCSSTPSTNSFPRTSTAKRILNIFP